MNYYMLMWEGVYVRMRRGEREVGVGAHLMRRGPKPLKMIY
jgi:hypothetical protein